MTGQFIPARPARTASAKRNEGITFFAGEKR